MADWCGLPEGVVALIARRLQLIEDFIAFRSACSSWRKTTTLTDFYTSSASSSSLPLLMLCQFGIDDDDDKNLEEYEVDEVGENDNSDSDDNNEIYQNNEIGNDENHEIDDENGIDEMDEMDKMEMVEMIVRKVLDDKRKFLSLVQGKDDPEANHEPFPDANPKRHRGFPESNLECKCLSPVQRPKDPEVDHQRKFFSLSKGKRCNISLPEAKGMECIGSKGWLIMVESSTCNMCLFHPITRAHIPLPKAPSTVNPDIKSAVLSASPSKTSDYVVMVAFVEVEPPYYLSGSYVGFWKPGNQTWTRIEIPSCVEDLNYYNGKFYALTETAQVWMCDVSGANPNNKASKITELPWKMSRPRAQLVECGGRLLIVAPFFCYPDDLEPQHDLKMVELDLIKGSYSIMTSLGSSTVFLGRNEGFSIDANRFQGIVEPNLIYFGDGSSRVAARGRNNVSRPRLGWGKGVWINF